jgi:sarcosine oxidase subunit gamma
MDNVGVSPLSGWVAPTSAGLRLAEVPFLTQVNLRLGAKGPAADAVGLELGVRLPVEPGTSVRSGALTVLWLGPDEWLMLAPWSRQERGQPAPAQAPAPWLLSRQERGQTAPPQAPAPWPGGAPVEQRLRAAIGAEPASVVDVSAQRTTILVAGAHARDLLAHGCALDLHPTAFPVGRCAQTLLARAQVVLVAIDGEPAYWLLVRSSFARYVAEWLEDASVEYR